MLFYFFQLSKFSTLIHILEEIIDEDFIFCVSMMLQISAKMKSSRIKKCFTVDENSLENMRECLLPALIPWMAWFLLGTNFRGSRGGSDQRIPVHMK